MTVVPPVPPVPDLRDPLAFLPRQDRHKPKCGPVRPSKVSRKRAYVLIGVHVLIGLHIWHWLATGSSLTPVEPSEAMQTIEGGRINAGFVLFLVLIAGTLIFGRFFCGWACHVVALQDLSAWLLGKIGLKPRPLRSRLLVLAPWVVAGHMFFWQPFRALVGWREAPLPQLDQWELHMTTDNLWQTFPGWLMTIMTVVVVGFLIVWWLGAKGFCTHGCPYGAFFAIADRFAPVRIKVTDACNGCGHCTNVCTSNVRVHEEVAKHGQLVDPGCMKCLDCVSVCPKDALYVGLAMPKPFAKSQQRIVARADLTWPEELLVAVVAFVATQYGWRSAWFTEGIPLLLAVGLGVLTGVAALLLLRLLTKHEVTFQHTPWKKSGRWTAAGRLGATLSVLAIAFATHCGLCQWRRDALFAAVKAIPKDATQAQVSEVLDRAETALAREVFDDPFTRELRALLWWRLGRERDGAKELLALFEERGFVELDIANLNLAMSCLPPRGMRPDVAEKAAMRALQLRPNLPMAQSMLQVARELLAEAQARTPR